LVGVHSIPENSDNQCEQARVGIPARAYFLLRPDGHIALAGFDFSPDSVVRYFSETLHLRGWHVLDADGTAIPR
ncbi:MAG: hypothetical protein ACREXT_19860, partial [Gammaproteobacteria bacterium]